MGSAAAHAQTGSPRLYITVNGGAQAAGDGFADRREFPLNAETATAETRHPFKTGALFDGGAGVRLWKAIGAGVSVSHFSSGGTAAVSARLPHPFQFETYREVTGESGRARRKETGVHVQLLFHLPTTGRFRGILFAGPSYVSMNQEVVREVRYEESYPYDTATFASADLSSATGSGIGFNAGIDAFWMFTERFGAGALVRLTRASVEVNAPANRRVDVDAGGVHVGLGARFIF